MQTLKKFPWKQFLLRGVLPCLLAVAAAFIARYQLELSDGAAPAYLAQQGLTFAALNAMTAFCLTLALVAGHRPFGAGIHHRRPHRLLYL